MNPSTLIRPGAVALGCSLAILLGSTTAGAGVGSQIVVPRGQPVQIAVVLDRSGPIGAPYVQGIRNAIQMAAQLHPAIRGFRIQLNDGFDGQCGDPNDVAASNAAAARAVVSNQQNIAVIGHMCSLPFGGPSCADPSAASALSIYQAAGLVTINGSTTNDCLPPVGPTVFNSTAVPDPLFGGWYATVAALPSDQIWRFVYRLVFGTAPTDFADLYFDAANLLFTRIAQDATVENGQLVIDRAALVTTVRTTANFPGVTGALSFDGGGYRIDDPAAPSRWSR